MKILTSFSLVVATALSNLLFAQQLPPSIIWQKSLGGSGDDRANHITRAYDNGYLVVGFSKSNDGDVSGHHGSIDSTDGWVVKLSIQGAIEWQKSFGGTGNDELKQVINTNDGGYLAIGTSMSKDGDFSGNHGNTDAWVVKFDRQGNILWQKCFGGSGSDIPVSVKKTADNGYIIIGTTFSNDGNITGNHGRDDIWVFKIDQGGNLSWQRCYGGSLADRGFDILKTSENYFLLATDTHSRDGDFTGSAGNEPLGYILKIDDAGQLIQRSSYSGQRNSYVALKEGSNGERLVLQNYIACYPGDPHDGTAVKSFSSSLTVPLSPIVDYGFCRYPNYFSGAGYFTVGPDNLIPLPDGNALLSGSTGDTISVLGNHGLTDGFLSKFTPAGAKLWQKCYGGSNQDQFQAFIAEDEFTFLAAGFSRSNNGDVSGNHGNYDFWIVKLGQFNLIKGTVFADYNLNGIKDSNEPLVSKTIVSSTKQNLSSASPTYNGYFNNAVDTGTYLTTITSSIPYYTSTPVSKSSVFGSYNNTDSMSFALQPIPNKRDYVVHLFGATPARPGFDLTYRIEVINKGTDTLTNRQAQLRKDSRLTFLNSVPSPNTISGDSIKWNIPFLAPWDTVLIVVKLKVPAPPAVVLNDILYSTALIDTSGDLRIIDNTSILRQSVVGSFDPNDKMENHAGSLFKTEVDEQSSLLYTIRFQNTGNDTAFNISIRDTLSSKLDLNSIEMISASHPYQLSIKDGNKLTWTFPDIKLPDSNHNEPASHGYITYSIKPKSTLVVGDTIKNSASIYFDFNLPVKTNTEITVVKLPPPPQPAVSGIQNDYCSNQGVQKGKITNLPAANSGITVTVKLDGNTLSIAADSTFSFDVSSVSGGSHTLKVNYTNSTASDSVVKTFIVTAAVTPDVNVSANITNITSLANPVVVTAANGAGGGTGPLYTFASNRSFTSVLQPEGSNNIFNLNPANLQVGDNWIYVRMKTSLTCYTTQTNIDSILLKRDAITGIIDVDDPTRVINIFPNPFSRQINLSGLNPTKSYEITIVDLNGKQLLKRQVHGSTQFNMPLHSYSSGVYVLNLYDRRKQRLIGKVRLVKQ